MNPPECAPHGDGSPEQVGPTVIELRQYELVPRQREVLLGLFEDRFVESQEDLGMAVLGHFRDLDTPDRFVWLRGFPDMQTRPGALGRFYSGPVWGAHSDAANATMLDSDNVLLLRPHGPTAFPVGGRVPAGARTTPPSVVVVTTFLFREPVGQHVLSLVDAEGKFLHSAPEGSTAIALLRTETAPNNYPALPVREGEHAVVRIVRYDSVNAHLAHRRHLARTSGWTGLRGQLAPHLAETPDEKRLSPAARSLIR